MYQKAVVFCDEETAVKVLESDDPSMIKYLGRMVKNYQDCLWAGKRQLVLYDGLMAKFGQNQKLRNKLLATEETIMAECSVNDKIWGIGISMDDFRRFDLSEWVGINLLGNTLMLVRRDLKKQEYIKPVIDNNVYWFEMEKDKSVTLVKPNGERKSYSENNPHFNRTNQMLAGWQRANLYLMEENIWDSTAFGASMSAILGFYWKNIEGISTALLFSTPQNAESAIYPYLSKRQVKQCRENVKEFYLSKEAQQAWHDLVLYPVCLMTKRGSKTLTPVSMTALYEEGTYGFELTDARPVFIPELQQFFEESI